MTAAPEAAAEDAAGGLGSLRLLAKPTLLLLGFAAAGLALRLLPGLDRTLLDRAVVGRGVTGEVLFLAVGAALGAVGVPRQAVAFAGGYAFGALGGAALSLAAQVLACTADFTWARLVARGWVRRRLLGAGEAGRPAGRLARLDVFLTAHPFSATLTLRLLPVGNNLLLNLLAGVSGVRAAGFLLASALGYLPQTAIFALLGSGVRVDRTAQLAVAAGLFIVSAAIGLLLLRRWRRSGIAV